MTKKLLSIILSICMLLSITAGLDFSALADDYIEIWNIEDLYNVRYDMDASYIMMADIDMTKDVANGGDYCFLNNNGWNPIGSDDKYSNIPFKGVFDGNNHTITGLRIEFKTAPSGAGDKYLGLFAKNAGTIKNLNFKNIIISNVENSSNYKYDGTVAGYNSGEINNCHVESGKISSYFAYTGGDSRFVRAYIGGITGYSTNIIKACSNNADLYGSAYHSNNYGCGLLHFGGICGYVDSGYVTECFNSGNMANYSSNRGTIYEGAIAGYTIGTSSKSAEISNCYNTASITNVSATNSSCYLYSITYVYDYTKINNCYNIGKVLLGETKKPFNSSSVNKCYYLNDTCTSSTGATALSNLQMTKAISFDGFDFDNVWIMDDSTAYKYPQLRNNRQDTEKEIDTIEFKKEPSTHNYRTEDKLIVDGSITVYYMDGTFEDMDITEDMLSGYDMNTAGDQTVTVTYRNQELTYDIKVVQRPNVVGVTLVSAPAKTEFVRATALDYTGAVARVFYDDGTSENINLTPENATGANIGKSGTYIVTYSYKGYSVNFSVKVVPLRITGIEIKSMPTKTSYIEGQEIDITGLEIGLTRNDGTSESVTGYTLDYSNKAGLQTVTVSYNGYTTTFDVDFSPRQLISVSVKSQPNKVQYFNDENFDKTGMVVTASYNNGLTEEITDYQTSEITDEIGTQVIEVKYGGKSTYIAIDVIERAVTSISITKAPLKTSYIIGADFDKSGMEVTAFYNDGTSKIVDDYYVSSLPTISGAGVVTVSYMNKTANIDVTMRDKKLVKINVTAPTKTVYRAGESFDNTGMVVYAVYDNNKSEIVSDYTVTGFGDSQESNLITVTYKGLTANFEVFIHNPTNNWVTSKVAECGVAGEQVMYCTTCNEIIDSKEIQALEHKYSSNIVAPTCTEKGYTEYTCSNCSNTYRDSFVDETGHNTIIDYALPSKCDENGLTEGSHCNVCGAVIVAQTVVAKKRHSYKEQTTSVASCTTRGVVTHTCEFCGDSYETYTNAKNHNFVLTLSVPATCTTAGYKQYTCSNCTESYKEQASVVDHTPVVDKAVPATCEKSGLTAGSHCSDCGAIITAQNIVSAKGHTPVAGVEIPATCDKAGMTAGSKCSVCGEIVTAQTVIKATGHDYVEKVTAPTCTEIGYSVFTCSKCGDSYKGNYKSTADHIYSKKTVRATCSAKGYTLNTCTLCGDNYKSNYTDVDEHDYVSAVTKQSSCTEKGVRKYTCTLCGDTYNTDIEMIEHTAVTDNAVAPTCTTTGLTEGSHCSVCDKVLVTQEVVAKKAHTPVTDKAVSATYTKTGLTAGSHCSVCNAVITKQATVAKKTLAKPTSVKATASSKGFKLTWKKVSAAKGYEIQYSTSSSFSSPKKLTISSNSTVSKSVTKLTGNKKYYVRIRSYYKDSNGTAYSSWVSTSVTTKK